jgi:hypothetical protein
MALFFKTATFQLKDDESPARYINESLSGCSQASAA